MNNTRETIITGLKYCMMGKQHYCSYCPYDQYNQDCRTILCQDAINELQAAEPIYDGVFPYCNNCHHLLSRAHKYCFKCGRRVKWDG